MIAIARSIPVRTAALFLAWSFAFSGVGFADRAVPATASDLSSIHIDNFGRVNPNYYRGAAPPDAEYAKLAAFGVRTIVDLRGDDTDAGDAQRVELAGMKYMHLPMTTRETPSSAVIEKFLEIVSDRANQPGYVHCVGGRHRTGVMTAVYRMSQEGWTAAQAFREMKQYKFGADFLHPEFTRFVQNYKPGLTSPADADAAPDTPHR